MTTEQTYTRTVWQLARLAGVAYPDALDSPGGKWLRLVANTVEDVRDYGTTDESTLRDAVSEQADNLVPVYTYDRWKVFVDLAAWEVYTEGLAPPDDMTAMAGVALYLVAERLLDALWEKEREAFETDPTTPDGGDKE